MYIDRKFFLMLFALGFPACSDPTGPCDARGACIVEGVDLVVEPATVVNWPGMRVDSITGLPVVAPGDTVVVEYFVRNRGDERSEPALMYACVSPYGDCWDESRRAAIMIPPVAPGQEARDTFRVVMHQEIESATDSLATIHTFLPELESSLEFLNNRALTKAYLAAPRVRGAAIEVPSVIRVGERITLSVRLENAARYAAVPPDTLFVCAGEYDPHGCSSLDPIFFRHATAAIPIGGDFSQTLSFIVPPDAGSREFRNFDARFNACIGYFSYGAPRPYYGCAYTADVLVLPDLDLTCAAATIASDTVLTGQTQPGLCDLHVGDNAQVWSFEAQAGDSLSLEFESVESIHAQFEVVDHDGNWRLRPTSRPLTFTIPATGRYHIAVGNAGAYSLSFQKNN